MTRTGITLTGLAALCAVGGGTATFAAMSRAMAPVAPVDPASQPHVPAGRAGFAAIGAAPNELDLVALIATAQRRLRCARVHVATTACEQARSPD